ncbi:retrovirus-related pol polyprotein from transposon TNT 1-94 [Tanacetum coccineum]
MSTQQDIYAAGSQNRPPMLNKENYVPWLSHLLRYAKSRPNGKLIYNSIMNGPYVRRMIHKLGDADREVPVNETFHEQTDDELTEKELKQVKADDQVIQTILLGLPGDIYAAVDSCETTQEIWLRLLLLMGESIEYYYHRFSKFMNDFKRNKHFPEKIASNLKFLNNLQPEWSRHVTIVHQTKDLHTTDYTQLYDFLKYNQKEVDDLRAKRFAKIHDPLALMENSNNPFNYPVFHPDQPSPSIYMQKQLPNNNYNPQPSFNQNYMQQPMANPKDISDPTTAMNMALVLMAKAFKLNYSTLTNNIQRISSNPRNRQIAQPGMNMGQDRQMQMVGGNGGNKFRQYDGQNNVGNQNWLIVVLGIANPNPNGNGLGHLARNCTVRPRRRDAAYLQNQLLFPQKEEAGIQLNVGEFDLMATVADLDEIKEVNENCILMANLQQASTSGIQTNKAPVYDLDGLAEVSSVEQDGGTVDQHHATVEETQAAKFVRDFKSLAKEADKSLVKHKALELEIKRLLRAVVSQDIMSIVQSNSVVDTSNLQTELDRIKERFENCIIKKENEYAKLWNDWYKKCEECKYDKILYDKAYNDMQQKIERLEAQLGDLKELEFQVRSYEKENAHLKTTYKNLFDSISVTRAQTKTIIDSLQDKLHDTIYENAKLRAQLFDKVSKQKDTTKGTSVNTQFCKQSILGKAPSSSKPKLYVVTPFQKSKGLPKIDETHASSKPVTSNSVPTPQESKVVKNDNVIVPRMFRINPIKPFREEKSVPNKVRASVRTKPITISQPHVITVNSDSNGFSSTGVDNTAKTGRPQPRSNTKNDRVPSASKSSCSKNKEVEVEEHPRNVLLSKNKKHMSSECNNVKLAIRNDKSKVVCAMCKKCLITANHDVCVLNYVNDMNSCGKKQKANVSNTENQKKQKPKDIKPKKIGSNERLASPNPSKPRYGLRWSPTGRIFDLKGKLIVNSESECQSNCSNGDNACTSNPQEPTIKWFPNSTSFLGSYPNLFMFCDLDLEVAFRRNTYFVKNLEGFDLLKGNRTTNLYTINLHEMAFASPICLMDRATSTKSWLWHQRLSHLNFDTINYLARNDLFTGLPKFKYYKEHLCPSYEQGKSKRASHPPKPVPNSKQRLHLLHMDLCGPMRIASINGKRYVLVIVGDYSRYTWVHFLKSKDEAPEVIKTFLKRINVLIQSLVIIIRTDNDTEFKNQILKEYFDSVGISHQASSVRTL